MLIMDNTSNNLLSEHLFFSFPQNSIGNDLNIIEIGHEKCLKDKDPIIDVKKNYYCMHYILKGKGVFIISGNSYELSEDDIFFCPINTTYSYFQNSDEPWEYIWVGFNGHCAKELSEKSLFDNQNPTFRNMNKQILQVFLNFFSQDLNMYVSELFLKAEMYKLFALFIQIRNPETLPIKKQKSIDIVKIMEYIENNFQNPSLSTAYIAQKFYINSNYLSKKFSERTKIPISKYIMFLRLKKASELLMSSGLSIKEIALKVGYTDPFFFSNLFKKYYNVAPKHYNSSNSLATDEEFLMEKFGIKKFDTKGKIY